MCLHLNCGCKLMTKADLRIHMSYCEWRDEYEVDRIVSQCLTENAKSDGRNTPKTSISGSRAPICTLL